MVNRTIESCFAGRRRCKKLDNVGMQEIQSDEFESTKVLNSNDFTKVKLYQVHQRRYATHGPRQLATTALSVRTSSIFSLFCNPSSFERFLWPPCLHGPLRLSGCSLPRETRSPMVRVGSSTGYPISLSVFHSQRMHPYSSLCAAHRRLIYRLLS